MNNGDLQDMKAEHEDLQDVVEDAMSDIPEKKFKDTAFGRTIAGKNKAGKIIGTVLDIGEKLAPSIVGKIRDVAQTQTKPRKPMIKKILSLKNFINVRDENGNLSWQEVAASVIQLAIAAGLTYLLVTLGIFDQVVQLIGS